MHCIITDTEGFLFVITRYCYGLEPKTCRKNLTIQYDDPKMWVIVSLKLYVMTKDGDPKVILKSTHVNLAPKPYLGSMYARLKNIKGGVIWA